MIQLELVKLLQVAQLISLALEAELLQMQMILIFLLQLSLRGNIFVYQGEELGLPQARIPFEKLQDPEAFTNWPHTLGRDGARTPMPWKHDQRNAGFSTKEPWLPIGQDHQQLAVDTQQGDPGSVLSFFRQIVQLRKSSPALKYGELEFIDAPDGVLAFVRTAEDESAYCVFNLSNDSIEWSLPGNPEIQVRAEVGTDSSGGKVPTSVGGYCGYVGFVQ